VSRVLLIGLDSADALLIERWAAAGHLPTFAGLMREGSWSRIGTTAEVMHVSAWPSIYTGARPGRHGLYHAYQTRAGSQLVHRTLPQWLALPPFWRHLDAAGRRCIVFDAFMDSPLDGFGGIQICDWGTWTWFNGPFVQPADRAKEIRKRFGAYPAPEHLDQVTIPDQLRFRDRLVRAAAVKADAAIWLLGAYPWDMAFVTFGEPHGAGHYLWHSSDAAYPLHGTSGCPAGIDPLLEVYVAVDAAMGRLIEACADDRTTVLVTSGDGMGPNYSGAHLLPALLHKLDLFHAPSVGGGAGQPAGKPKQSPAAMLRAMIPLSVRQSLNRCLSREARLKLSMRWANADIDWQRTRAFCIPNANEGFVRINLAGREPLGNVAAGADYEALVGRIDAELRGLVNPTTGCRCAEHVHRIDEVFPGSERAHLPDVTISWDFGAEVLDRIHGPSAGLVTGKRGYEVPAYYTGNHRPFAFLAARGPGVRVGRPVEGAHIVDIAPTVCARLGVDPAPQFEGRAVL
jgi:predicted AlkP superfamily phosphohydrolase/phosphomutase